MINDQIKKWQNELVKLDFDYIAWAFPENKRELTRTDEGIYPGVVLLVREVSG